MPDGMHNPRPIPPKLVLHVPGAREDQLERGIQAAAALLFRDGEIALMKAMAANGRRDFIMFDADGQPINDMSQEEWRLAGLWADAGAAAEDACCSGRKADHNDCWLGIDAGSGTIRPWYVEAPIATIELKE